MSRGFSLIELMVVISLFGISASLITASYLTFERNARVKNAATSIKNELRLVQNKATSGDKGPKDPVSGQTICASTSTLGGWYIKLDSGAGANTSFTIGGDCITGTGEANFTDAQGVPQQVVQLPPDTKISSIACSGCTSAVSFFFRPLTNSASFHNGVLAPPDFLDNADTGKLKNNFNNPGAATIVVSNIAGTRTSQIVVLPTGEVQ